MAVAAAGGDNVVGLAAGSQYQVATGGGNDLVFANGSGIVDVGAGTNTVEANGGGNVVFAAGTNDLIALGAEADTVGESGTHAVIFAGSGADVIADGGAGNTVVGGAGPLTIYGGSNGLYALSTSTSTVVASEAAGGSETIVGSASGAETVYGGTSDLVFADGSSLTFVGEGGQSTISDAHRRWRRGRHDHHAGGQHEGDVQRRKHAAARAGGRLWLSHRVTRNRPATCIAPRPAACRFDRLGKLGNALAQATADAGIGYCR